MGCRSDYMEQTDFEKRVQRTAQLLQWFWEQANITYRGSQIRVNTIAENIYPSKDDGDHVVAFLCKELRHMLEHDKPKFEKIVYGRNKVARELANWWEDHEKADEERLSQDKVRRTEEWKRFYETNDMSNITSSASMTRGVVQWFIDNGYEVPKLSDEIEE